MIHSTLSNDFPHTLVPTSKTSKPSNVQSTEAPRQQPSLPRQASDSLAINNRATSPQKKAAFHPAQLAVLFSSIALVGVGLWQHKRIRAWLEEAKSHFVSPKPIEPTGIPEPPVQPLSSTHSSNYRPSSSSSPSPPPPPPSSSPSPSPPSSPSPPPPSSPSPPPPPSSPPPPTNALETVKRQILERLLKRLQTYITNHKSDEVDSLNAITAITANTLLELEKQIAEASKLLGRSEAELKVLRVNALQQLFNPANPLIAGIHWEAYLAPTVDINHLLETTQDAKYLESYLKQLEQLRQRNVTDSDVLCNMMTVNTLPNKDEQRRTLYNQLEVKDRDSRIADYQRFFLQWAKAIEQRFKGELHNGFPAEGATVQVQNVPTQWPASLDWGQTEVEVLQNCVGYLKAQPDNTMGVFLKEAQGSYHINFQPIVWAKINGELYGIELQFNPNRFNTSLDMSASNNLASLLEFKEGKQTVTFHPLVAGTPIYQHETPLTL